MSRPVIATTALILSVALVGCAGPEVYTKYADQQAAIEVAKYNALTAKYTAMSTIASSGDATAKVAAVIAMAMGDMAGGGSASTRLTPPKDPSETALQWASILVPAAVQSYGIGSNKAVAMRQSDNATALAIQQSDNQVVMTESTNNTMLGFGALAATAPITATTPTATIDRPAVAATAAE